MLRDSIQKHWAKAAVLATLCGTTAWGILTGNPYPACVMGIVTAPTTAYWYMKYLERDVAKGLVEIKGKDSEKKMLARLTCHRSKRNLFGIRLPTAES
jgi:hypothetical protein